MYISCMYPIYKCKYPIYPIYIYINVYILYIAYMYIMYKSYIYKCIYLNPPINIICGKNKRNR